MGLHWGYTGHILDSSSGPGVGAYRLSIALQSNRALGVDIFIPTLCPCWGKPSVVQSQSFLWGWSFTVGRAQDFRAATNLSTSLSKSETRLFSLACVGINTVHVQCS